MKKHMKLVATVATLLIAASGIITFEACNKKNEIAKNIPELNAQELTDFDKEMILFGEKMKSAKKGGETMPLAEAIRNLTNYENFKMADASIFSAETEIYNIESIIPVNEGNVNLSDLYALYQSNKQSIKTKLQMLDGDIKNVYCINTKLIDGGKGDGDVRIITRAILSGSDDTPEPIWGFDETLCWGAYDDCDTCTGGNAFTVLAYRLNSLLERQQCDHGYRLVLYDHDDEYIFSTDYLDPNSPNGHYGLINYEYDNHCLTAAEMSYYLLSAYNKIHEWQVAQALEDRYATFVIYHPFQKSILDVDFYKVSCTYVGFDD